MRSTVTVVTVLILITTLLGCRSLAVRQAPRCDLLAGEEQFLRRLDFAPMDREGLHAWVSSTFAVPQSAIRGRRISGEPHSIIAADWSSEGNDYSATIDERLRSVKIRFDASHPRVQDVLDCFGPPDFYRATYLEVLHTNDLYLELWYPGQGVVAQVRKAVWLGQKVPPRLSGRDALDIITYTRSRDPAEMVTIAPILLLHSLDRYPLKPWPGSLEAIEIEIDPAIRER